MKVPNIYIAFDKVKKVLYSCTTIHQLNNADNMIYLFEEMYGRTDKTQVFIRRLDSIYLSQLNYISHG